MKNIAITITAVLTLIGCSPEEQVTTTETTTEVSSPLIGKWLAVQKPYGIPEWDIENYIECEGDTFITFREDMTTESLYNYKMNVPNRECKADYFYLPYEYASNPTPELQYVEYWREIYSVQFLGDTILLGYYEDREYDFDNDVMIWGELTTIYELRRVN
tara:strand:- start:46 stop:525 length:480 start_codon:yes stop_codon:yes gene_type:complete